MRTILVVLSFLFPVLMSAQGGFDWRRAAMACLSGISGGAHGLNQASLHHWSAFQARFPKANPDYWNPAVSWKNKYAGGDVANGPKFPGSTTIFVALTDGYHATATVHRATMLGAGITIGIGQKRKFKYYLIDSAISAGAFMVGFNLTYKWIY